MKSEMRHPVEVRALEPYRLWIAFSDGVTGEVDLADLAGRGVFAAWNQPGVFQKVSIGPGRSVAWSDELELCSDALYMRLTGKSPKEALPDFAMPISA